MGQDRARDSRPLRRRAVLRRRDDHARDLRAVRGRGDRGRRTRAAAVRAAVHARRADRPVPDPALRHRRDRPPLRPGDDRLVRGSGRGGDRAADPPPGDPARAVAALRAGVLHRPSGDRVHLARLGRARGDRRGGALRRHGPLRRQADPACVVPRRLPRADAELHGPGLADRRAAERDLESVLPAVPGVVANTDDRARDRRDADRVPGGDLGRLLGHAPGGPARLPAAADDPPHVRGRDRPGLRAGGELGPVRRRLRARDRLRLLGASSRPRTGSR